MKTGPIILVEDDADDKAIFEEVLQQLEIKNKLLCFNYTSPAFDYLKTTRDLPFIIFCDVNMPHQNEIEFKSK